MEKPKTKTIGTLRVIAYFLFIIGCLDFLNLLFRGGHKNDDGEWISRGDMITTMFFTFGIGLFLYVIDKIRNNN